MGLFDFFKAKKEGNLIEKNNDEVIDDEERLFNENKNLIKEVSLLKEGDIDGAYDVLNNQLRSFNKTDYAWYNSNKAEVYVKLCILSYKDKNYKNYLKFYFKWLYNTTLRNACLGVKFEMETNDLLSFLAPTKVAGCFKKLNKNDSKILVNELLNEYFDSKKEDIKKIYFFVKHAQEQRPKVGETGGGQINRYCGEDTNFKKMYNKLNNDDFDSFIENKLMMIF